MWDKINRYATSTDVILEKRLVYRHSGNITYNNIIAEYNNIYVNGTRAETENIIGFIIVQVRNRDPLGRFFGETRGSDVWVDVDLIGLFRHCVIG